jgi:hypothetical protein
LELGRHLVRELKLHDGVDTLGRWMAHHVAELITDAKRQRKGPKRTRAEKEATELILKIWEHREALPRHAYPLAQYEELFKILDRLQPNNNPFRYSLGGASKTDELTAVLFHQLSRLVICMLLMKPLSLYKVKAIDEAVLNALSEEERRVWDALNKWNELFLPRSDPESTEGGQNKPRGRKINLNKIALRVAGETKKSLAELETELQTLVNESEGLKARSKAAARKTRRSRLKRK